MPRMDLDEDEVALIRDRRHRNAANASYNEGLNDALEACIEHIKKTKNAEAAAVFKTEMSSRLLGFRRSLK